MKKLTLWILCILLLGIVACGEDVPQTTTPIDEVATVKPTDEPVETNEPPTEQPEQPTEEATIEPTDEPTIAPTPTEEVYVPVDADWEPRLLVASPQQGEQTMLDGAITLRFDQEMDQASVEEAFEIVDSGGDKPDGAFTWSRPDTLIFTPISLTRAQTYTVKVKDTARSKAGMLIKAPVEVGFETVGFLEVSQITPADEAEAITADSAVTIFFNRPVVPLVSTGQQDDLPVPITIEPAIEGNGRWIGTSIYRFEPADTWQGATEYTVTAAEGLEDVTGNLLESPFVSKFTTDAPQAIAFTADVGAGYSPSDVPFGQPIREPIDPNQTISVTFNMPMDRSSTEAAITVDPSAPLTFSWADDNRSVGVAPAEQLPLETKFELTIGESAQSLNGNATLKEAKTLDFQTFPFPRVENYNPERDLTSPWDLQRNSISVYFVSPMNRETVLDGITIEPEPADVTFDAYGYDNSQPREFFANFQFVPETEYTVTISGDVEDVFGNKMGEPFTWSFRTPDRPATVAFNLPQQIAQLSTAFPRAVDIVHANAETADVLLKRVAPDRLITTFQDRYERQTTGFEQIDQWNLTLDGESGSVNLPLVDGGELPTGLYGLSLRSPEVDSDFRYSQNQELLVVVAGTNLVIKETPRFVHMWVTDLATAAPVPNRDVDVHRVNYNQASQLIGTVQTDENGFAQIAKPLPAVLEYPYQAFEQQIVAVVGAPGDAQFGMAATEWQGTVSPYELGVRNELRAEENQTVYLWTDRPLYRPGDTVYIKGWMRTNGYGRYAPPTITSLNIGINNWNNGRERLWIAEVDANGVFNSEVVIPDDWGLGTTQLYVVLPGSGSQISSRPLTIAEFRKPEFFVELTPSITETVRGETVDVTVAADYAFGGSASDLNVRWTLYSNPFTLPFDEYRFGTGGFFHYGGGSGGQYMTSGEGVTDGNGNVTITITPEMLENMEEGGHTMRLEATVVDESNLAVTGQAEFVLHAADLYAGIRPGAYGYPLGQNVEVDVIAVDWDGEAVPNADIEVALYEREWTFVPSQSDSFRGSWEPTDTVVSEIPLTVDEKGEATAVFSPTKGGSYIAKATVTDESGRTHTSEAYLYVYGPGTTWRASVKDRKMEIVVSQNEYQVGDEAELIVQAPFNGTAWMTIERGELIEERLVELTGDALKVPITADYAPNVFVTFALVKGVDESDAPYADLRYGAAELVVDASAFNINVELTPNTTALDAGDTVEYTVTTTDADGNGVAADVALALVDKTLLSLMSDPAQPLFDVLYSPQPLRSQIGSGLLVSGEGLEIELPTVMPGGMGGGGGGDGVMAMEAMADSAEASPSARAVSNSSVAGNNPDIRTDFRDTAFWENSITTDANGEAIVSIPLPDNLTTWQLTAKSMSPDTLVGENTDEIVVSRPVLIRPITPRFLTFGDRIELGAIVNNNSGAEQAVTVTLTGTGVTFEGETSQVVTIAADDQQIVRWPVTVNDEDTAEFLFTAEAGDYRDASIQTVNNGQPIPIVRYDAEDIVATAGVLDDENRLVEAVLLPPLLNEKKGDVLVDLSPSLAAALIDSLSAVNRERYWTQIDCAYWYVNQLLPNVATIETIRALDLDLPDLEATLDAYITEDVARLVALQDGSGGWRFCPNSELVNTMMSANSLLALARARDAGYSVDDAVISKAVNYLEDQVPDDTERVWEANRKAFLIYVLAAAGQDMAEPIESWFDDGRAFLDPYGKGLLILANPEGANVDALLSDLNDSVDLSATGASWENDALDWNNLNSQVRGTSIIISALTTVDEGNPLLPSAVRWLMEGRTAQRWASNYDTAWAIMALADWMDESNELEGDYTYQLRVNGDLTENGAFSSANIATSETKSVPLSALNLTNPNFFDFTKEGDGRLYYTAHLDAFISADSVSAVNRGFSVERNYYDATCDAQSGECEPLTEIQAGQQVRVELTIIAERSQTYVIVEDPIPSGTDAINPNFETSATASGSDVNRNDQRWGYWGWWQFTQTQFRDEKVVFSADYLPKGTYQYTYHLQAVVPGEYQTMPTIAKAEFRPEVFGRANGVVFTISE